MYRALPALAALLASLIAQAALAQLDKGPCTCAVDGVSGGVQTDILGCTNGTLSSFFCYVVDPSECNEGTFSTKFEGAKRRQCLVDDAIFTAATNGDAALVEDLLLSGQRELVNELTWVDSQSPVHVAARNADPDVLDLLLIFGYDHCGTEISNMPKRLICSNGCSEEDEKLVSDLLEFTEEKFPCDFGATGLISGGTTAKPGRYPYIVSLRRRATRAHYCGGTLIAEDMVLTAAHCLDVSQSLVAEPAPTLYIGGYQRELNTLFSAPDPSNVEVFGTAGAAVHPRWQRNFGKFGTGFDVAVIRLSGTSKKLPVRIGTVEPGEEATTLGWGRLVATSAFPGNLQEATGMNVTVDECASIYKELGFTLKHVVCAGTGMQDFCTGDDGGPLLKLNTSDPEDDVLVGVASTKAPGIECGTLGIPGVYSRLTPSVQEWIEDTITTLRRR
ncbi:unnamed protein product [Ostreobium quekettii]|uniref:Peptidase S1 domain-containing protein n=1 Tax=Ostreobium quekettii TaxID=121088 RepID=A0A8S1J128_9CHLO|nr:unnamed protein product [Ostreobium quekettii]